MMHEAEVHRRLEYKMTMCAVRYQAQRLGLKKAPERWTNCSDAAIFARLADAESRVTELLTIQKILQDKIRTLERQLRAAHARPQERSY